MKVYKFIVLFLTCFLLSSANLYAQSSGGGTFGDDDQNNPNTGTNTGGTFGDSDQTNPNTEGGSDSFSDSDMGGIPLGDDPIITFADANVKACCVAYWDTNGDSELSEAEAAAVTTIGQVFSYWTNNITSFDELQYFTGLTSIVDWAFRGSGLTSITIPNNVTSIGRGAFKDCTSLTSITIPNSVTSIGMEAFKDCTSLTSITIPESVTSIDEYTFYNCDGLTSITIPNSVTSIGYGAFGQCI